MATLASKSRRGDLRRLVQATQNQLFACVQATLFADPWSFAGHLPIGEAELQSLHGALLRDLLPAEDVGCWRSHPIAIHSPLSGKMIARPVPATEVAEKMSDLMEAFDRGLWTDLDPLIRAGMFHVRFETIHPFADGNGRVGRMVLVSSWTCSAPSAGGCSMHSCSLATTPRPPSRYATGSFLLWQRPTTELVWCQIGSDGPWKTCRMPAFSWKSLSTDARVTSCRPCSASCGDRYPSAPVTPALGETHAARWSRCLNRSLPT